MKTNKTNQKDNILFGGFWSPERLLNTNKPLLIAMEPRGVGKSTGMGLYCINDFYQNGIKFLYVRRTEDELKRTRKSYFAGALKIYNNTMSTAHVWTWKEDTYTDEDGQVVGYTVPLSLADKYKSATFGADGVRTIIYDEFILRRGKEAQYLGSDKNFCLEYDLLIGLYQTTDRAPGHRYLNETKIFCLGNFAQLYNPILMGCGASGFVEHDSKFVNPKSQPWAIELHSDSEAAAQDMSKSYGYILSREEGKQTDYENDGFIHSDQIRKLKSIRLPLLNLTYKDRAYGLWEYDKEGLFYVSRELCAGREIYALTGENGKINQVTALKYQWQPELRMMRHAAERGFLAFDSAQARNDILTYLDFTV